MAPFWISAFIDVPAADFDRSVEFWSAVTGYAASPARGENDEFLTLLPPQGEDYLRMQRLGSGAARIHLDLHVEDPRAAAERAVALGARVVHSSDHGYLVLASPAGLVFCLVTQVNREVPPSARWSTGRSHVAQVALDVSAASASDEFAFWQRLTGFTEIRHESPEFRGLAGAGMAVELLLQRLDEPRAAGMHLDLASEDRPAEVERHRALGARLDPDGPSDRSFTVLIDPAGLRYCVTDEPPR